MSQYRHYLNACTEIWMRGGNSDNVNQNLSDNDYYNGRSSEFTASRHIRNEQDRADRIRMWQEQEDAYNEFHNQESPGDYEPINYNVDDLPF